MIVAPDYSQPLPTQPTKGCRYVARIRVTHGDRVFEPGEPFPYEQLGLDEFRAYQMWQAAQLNVAPETTLEQPKQPHKFRRR